MSPSRAGMEKTGSWRGWCTSVRRAHRCRSCHTSGMARRAGAASGSTMQLAWRLRSPRRPCNAGQNNATKRRAEARRALLGRWRRDAAGFADSRGASIKTIAQSLVRGWEVITERRARLSGGQHFFIDIRLDSTAPGGRPLYPWSTKIITSRRCPPFGFAGRLDRSLLRTDRPNGRGHASMLPRTSCDRSAGAALSLCHQL